MTRWGVERSAHTTVPASPVVPTGVTEFMPSRSQGAEQPTERHAGRWALHALVVGGLATREQGTTDPDTATGGVVRVVREITGPLRLTGGSDDSPLAPVSKPPTRATRHFAGLLPQAAVPVEPAPGPVAAPVAHRAVPVSTELTQLVPVARSKGHVTSRHTAAEAAEPDVIRADQPGENDPATPTPGHYGAISGISTTGSGAPTEGGGSAAFLPAAVAASTMAFHRLPRATDVEVRRIIAEAPTVSPD